MRELHPSETDDNKVLSFEQNAMRIRLARELRTDAAALTASHGINPYSDFIQRYGCRPNCDQASAIGRLMGIQVRASDGTLQPRRTKKRKSAAAKNARSCEQTQDEYVDQILRLRSALTNLAKIESDPKVVIGYIDPLFGDASVIREHLAHAVHWINRFAKEWGLEQETHGGQRPV
jgi:hypothetical protein